MRRDSSCLCVKAFSPACDEMLLSYVMVDLSTCTLLPDTLSNKREKPQH